MPGGRLLASIRGDLTPKRVAIMLVLALAIGVPLGTVAGQQYVAHQDNAGATGETDRPTPPTPLTPGDGEVLVSRTPTFSWTPSEDASLVRYAVQYGLDPEFAAPTEHNAIVFGMQEPTYTPSNQDAFPPGSTVYWRVIAIDEWRNSSPWSPVHSFTTGLE